MRIKCTYFGLPIIFINLVVVFYSLNYYYKVFYSGRDFKKFSSTTLKTITKPQTKHLSKLVTIVIRDFEPQDNDVTQTVLSFIKIFPSIEILVLYDTVPYPPLDLSLTSNTTFKNVKLINLTPSLRIPQTESYPLKNIKTKYVLFVPDSSRIHSRQGLQLMVTELLRQPQYLLVAPFLRHKDINCLRINISIREWTLKYNTIKSLICDSISGKHVTLIESEQLFKLANAFLLPFPPSLYLQTASLNLKVKIIRGVNFHDGKPVLKSHHAQKLKQQQDHLKFKNLYNTFGIKQVIRDTGLTEWYGCTKDTPRCFGPVVHSMPSYLYEDKWTPPCCLANLRKTSKHVFDCLEEAGIRYWLEGGSLLGAMRSSDILPWDHDIDIGFNKNDLSRSQWLVKAKDKPVIDTKGFLWEKAVEGNFFKVHLNPINRIHVNLYPFYSINGSMIQDSWYSSHHKVTEFPENFLHPMSSIEFFGRQVPSPNNIRDFLELKFGRGCIENPEYPDPKLRFP